MAEKDSVLLVLGRIEGELKGIRELVHSTSEATNTRIDDMKESVNTRIDDHQTATDTRFVAMGRQINKKGMASGGAGGALVAGLVEMARAILNH